MTFDVVLSPQALKFLQRQDLHIQQRIRKALRLLVDPFSVLEHFEGEYYKLRIGGYRALCDIDQKTVLVRILEHRGRVYK